MNYNPDTAQILETEHGNYPVEINAEISPELHTDLKRLIASRPNLDQNKVVAIALSDFLNRFNQEAA